MYIHIHIPGKHSLFDVLEPNLLLVQSSFSQADLSAAERVGQLRGDVRLEGNSS